VSVRRQSADACPLPSCAGAALHLALRDSRLLQCLAPVIGGSSAVHYVLAADPHPSQYSGTVSTVKLLKQALQVQVGSLTSKLGVRCCDGSGNP
jgi:hypothetical protein